MFAAFGQGGLDAAAAFWHPEIEWRAVEGAADDVGVMRGQDAVRAYYQDWIDTMDELRAEVDEILFESGDQVAAVVSNSGRGRASGVRTQGRYFVSCTVRDGVIVSGREHETGERAVAAAKREQTTP